MSIHFFGKVFMVLVVLISLVHGAEGSLDNSFGTQGVVLTDFSDRDDLGRGIALHSDGRVFVVGEVYNGSDYDFGLAGYTAEGDLDYGCAGTATTGIGSESEDKATSIAIDSKGRIIVAGYTDANGTQDFALVRYLAEGGKDSTFGRYGKRVIVNTATHGYAQSVAIYTFDKIVVAGHRDDIYSKRKSYVMYLLNEDGTADTNFGPYGSGAVITQIGNNDYAKDIAIQGNGYIVLAGYSEIGAYDQKVFSLARYLRNGTLDNNFGNAGTVLTAIGSNGDQGKSVAIQPDSKIVVAGCSKDWLNDNFAVVRYEYNGIPDKTFGNNGKVTTIIGSESSCAEDVTILSDGKILVTGYSYEGTRKVFTVVRYNTDGSLDNAFDGDGKVITAVGSGDAKAFGTVVLDDGSIIAAGYAENTCTKDFALVKYMGKNAMMPAIYYLLLH